MIGCLLAVACFVAIESRALSSLEINANQGNPAESAHQVSFQSQSDEVKQDKGKKGTTVVKRFSKNKFFVELAIAEFSNSIWLGSFKVPYNLTCSRH